MKKAILLLLISFLFLVTNAQVAINASGNAPNSKAMLDVNSDTQGMLVPRMTTTQRNTFEATLSASEKGMLVFDTETNSFCYYNGTSFEQLSNGVIAALQDADGDTKVEVDKYSDDDKIYFEMNGVTNYRMYPGHLEVLNSGESLYFGYMAGYLHDYSYSRYNVGVGDQALRYSTTGDRNVAIGVQSMYSNTTGLSNTAVGYQSLRQGSGSRNSSFGRGSLYNNDGDNNCAFGYFSLFTNTSGEKNTAYGYNSLYKNTSGSLNVAVGIAALYNNTTKSSLVAIGDSALYNNGVGATSTQSLDNVAVGSKSLFSNTIGSYNTAIGHESMFYNTSGTQNAALGFKALYSNTEGVQNTALGQIALNHNSTGERNTSGGFRSLYSNITGHKNTAFGTSAMDASTTGDNNSSLGAYSLFDNTEGHDNTAIGYSSLSNNTTGDNNIAIGYKAGDNIITGSNNIIIGYDIDGQNSAVSNSLNIGNLLFGTGVDGVGNLYSSGNIGIGTVSPAAKLDVRGSTMQIKNISGNVIFEIDGSSGNSEIQFEELGSYKGAIGYNMTSDYLYFYEGGNVVLRNGNFGIGTTSPGSRLQVGESGDGSWARANSWYTFSDKRLKKDIVVIDNPLYKLNQISGYYYYWKDGKDNTRQLGVVAQEVEEVLPEIVATDDEGIKSVDYSKLTPLLIEALKEQQETIKKLEARIEALER